MPDQVPLEPLKVEPWLALPETAGRAVFEGAVAAEAAGATTAVWPEVTDFEPAEFVAVTTTCIVPPTSADASRYVEVSAPGTGAHPEPLASQRRHWYA